MTIVGKLAGPVVHVAPTLVGVALFNQVFNKGNNPVNVFGCPGVGSGGFDVQSGGVFHVGLDVLIRQLWHRDPLLLGGLYHLVINIGEVGDVINLVARKL